MGNAQIERARKNMSKKTFRCETSNRVTDGGRTNQRGPDLKEEYDNRERVKDIHRFAQQH